MLNESITHLPWKQALVVASMQVFGMLLLGLFLCIGLSSCGANMQFTHKCNCQCEQGDLKVKETPGATTIEFDFSKKNKE